MLPKWFNQWNEDNPTDVFRPAIILGGLGGAVFVAALLVAAGQPFATQSLQTGPRGTGMHVAEFTSDLSSPDPTIEEYYTDDPIVPEGGEPLAKDIYENVQVLGELTEDNFNRVMLAYTQWIAPDEGCNYCHAGADDGEYADDDLYTKVVARRMTQMTQAINEDWDGHVNANGEVGVTCSTCHRGQAVPSDIWFKNSPIKDTNMAGWSAVQNRATSTSQFTSLPSDQLEELLVNYGQISVHDLESRVEGGPADGARTWQDTERTFSLMNYMANSLGVNCVFCHNSRAFYDPEQNTPQWGTASLGISMVLELNNDYLIPLQETYPEERLGVVHADAPKAACKTCHKGYQKPYQGLNVIADWPELATTGAPSYE